MSFVLLVKKTALLYASGYALDKKKKNMGFTRGQKHHTSYIAF